MTTKKKLPLEALERQLDRTHQFFPRIDAKLSALFAITSGQIAVVALNLNPNDMTKWWIVVPLAAFFVAACWVFVNLYRCAYPHLEGGNASLVYFSEIAKLRESEYIDRITAVSEADHRTDVAGQIWRNSEIVSAETNELASIAAHFSIGPTSYPTKTRRNFAMPIEPLDERIEVFLSQVLDRTEARAVRNGRCKPEYADEYLTMRYIEATSNIIFGGAQYMRVDEVHGASIFLSRLGDGTFNRASTKRQSKCALQLVGHTHVFFPKYHAILKATFRHIIQSHCGHAYELAHIGVIILAAATLPGARSEIRRELRRRGIEYDRGLVSDELMIEKLHLIEEAKSLPNRISNKLL